MVPSRAIVVDSLLHVSPTHSEEERILWLLQLFAWLRDADLPAEARSEDAARRPLVKIKYLLAVLDRNLAEKKAIAGTLRSLLRDLSTLDLFCDVGLSRELALGTELIDRIELGLLPQLSTDRDMKQLLYNLFPTPGDAEWLSKIDAETFEKFLELLRFGEGEGKADPGAWNTLQRDIEDALLYLAAQAAALGVLPQIRQRLDHSAFRENAFFGLTPATIVAVVDFGDGEKVRELRAQINSAENAVKTAFTHLQENGVSVKVVYQLERVQACLRRMRTLIDIRGAKTVDRDLVIPFLAALIVENIDGRSARALIRKNVSMLARKIVERSAETGKHYITTTRAEYFQMLASACGGGFMTAFTILFKALISSLQLPAIYDGILGMFNYSLSFVGIQLAGFTLATKQPAMTAPALAARMHGIEHAPQLQALVDEIAQLIRSQVAAILGNLSLVVPTVLFLDWLSTFLLWRPLYTPEYAEKTVHSLSILGPTVIFAAFTGCLLWASSLVAGWADNFFVIHRLKEKLAKNVRLREAIGRAKAERFAHWLEHNVSALAGNVSLGCFLALIPAFAAVFRAPLEVRHVTLSTGSLAASLRHFGVEYFSTWDFWCAVLGIVAIGSLNLGVSFYLAFITAIRARDVQAPQRRAIKRAVFLRLRSAPGSFLLPPARKKAEAGEVPPKA